MSPKKLFIANWKLNHSFDSASKFLDAVLPYYFTCDVAIAPVALMLDFMSKRIKKSSLKLCAQDVFYEQKGAFTGEYSAWQLKELDVSFSIVGHSERRKLFFETDEIVAKKAQACLKAFITPVICVGESLAEREAFKTQEVITKQVRAVIDIFPSSLDQELIFAYEPLWAIGSGKSASLADIEEILGLIRKILSDHFVANENRILYGGSVSPENIDEISVSDVDGVLVGGASLQAESFLAMVEKLQGEKLRK